MVHSVKTQHIFQQTICRKQLPSLENKEEKSFLDGSFHGLHCQNQSLKMMTKNYCCIKISWLRKTMHSLHTTSICLLHNYPILSPLNTTTPTAIATKKSSIPSFPPGKLAKLVASSLSFPVIFVGPKIPAKFDPNRGATPRRMHKRVPKISRTLASPSPSFCERPASPTPQARQVLPGTRNGFATYQGHFCNRFA